MTPLRVAYAIATSAANPAVVGLVDTIPASEVAFSVITFDDGSGPLAGDLAARDVPLVALGAPGWRGLPIAVRRLRRAFARLQLDVVHSNLFIPGLAVELARAGGGPSSVYTRHHNRQHHLQRKRVHQRIDRWTATRAKRVVAVARAVGQTLVEEGVDPAHIEVVHNGFDWDALQSDAARVAAWRGRFAERSLVLAAGRLDPMKDLATLVAAAALVRARGLDVGLVVAGEGAPAAREELIMAARTAGIEDHLHLVGHVRPIADLYRAADAFAQASVDEACSQTITEAAGLAVPLAVTTTGGTREIVGDDYPEIPPAAPGLLADRIVRVLTERASASAEAAERADRVRREFSMEVMATGYMAAYRRAVGAGS